MSRELITKYPEVFDYTKIWMENITHVTARGSSEFGLTNTNKLLRSYDGCDGLKTGSTSKALFCISATAERNGIRADQRYHGRTGFQDKISQCSRTFQLWFWQLPSLYR